MSERNLVRCMGLPKGSGGDGGGGGEAGSHRIAPLERLQSICGVRSSLSFTNSTASPLLRALVQHHSTRDGANMFLVEKLSEPAPRGCGGGGHSGGGGDGRGSRHGAMVRSASFGNWSEIQAAEPFEAAGRGVGVNGTLADSGAGMLHVKERVPFRPTSRSALKPVPVAAAAQHPPVSLSVSPRAVPEYVAVAPGYDSPPDAALMPTPNMAADTAAAERTCRTAVATVAASGIEITAVATNAAVSAHRIAAGTRRAAAIAAVAG